MTVAGPAPPAAVDAQGALNFGTYTGRMAAVDWTGLSPRVGRGRPKRWHYVSIAGAEVVVAVAVVNLGWASSAFAYLFDRTGRRLRADLDVVAARSRAHVSKSSGTPAETQFRSWRLFVRLRSTEPGRWRLEARSPELTVDASLAESVSGPTLCALAPVPGGIADCTHKTPALHVDGVARAGGAVFDLSTSSAALDHTDGLLARSTRWRWASATDGAMALNLTEDFTAPYENALWLDGRIHRLGPVSFDFDPDRPDAPWRIRSRIDSTTVDDLPEPEVDLEFVPEGRRAKRTSLLVARSSYIQPVGTFHGTVAGTEVPGLVGVTEDHAARW